MKNLTRTLLLLTALAFGAAAPCLAQNQQGLDTDALRHNIELLEKTDVKSKSAAVQKIYRDSLMRAYRNYLSAIKQDLADLKSIQAAGGNSLESAAQVKQLTDEQSITLEKLRTLTDDAQEANPTDSATTQPTPARANPQMMDTVYRPATRQRSASVGETSLSVESVPSSDSTFRSQAAAVAPQSQVIFSTPTLDEPISEEAKEITGKNANAGAAVEIFKDNPTLTGNPDLSGIAASDGTFAIPVPAASKLAKGQRLYVRQKISANDYSVPSKPYKVIAKAEAEEATTAPSGAIGLLYGGSVISNQAQSFTQADPFFGFSAGYSSRDTSQGNINLRFEGVFTSAPRTATAPMEKTTGTTTATAAPGIRPAADDNTAGLNANIPFMSSRKSFDVDMRVYWTRPFLDSRYLRLGFFGDIGASTVLDKNELKDEDVRVGATNAGAGTGDTGGDTVKLDTSKVKADNDLKKYFEFGPMAEVYMGTPDKLFLQAFLGFGKFEALKGLYKDANGLDNYDTSRRFHGQLRIFPQALVRSLGSAKIAPMFGVDINASRGPDSLRFFSGFIMNFSQKSPIPSAQADESGKGGKKEGGTGGNQ